MRPPILVTVGRYEGFRTSDGLLVLDSETGEVVLVPDDGGPPVVRREATRSPSPGATSSGTALAPAPMRQSSAATDAFEREVLATYPTPVARAYQRFLRGTDPRHRLRLMVDTFTTTLKLWAMTVASEYLAASEAREPALNELIFRDLSRPLISSWNRVIHHGLSTLRQLGVDIAVPALEAAYDELERRCRDRVSVRVRYEDRHGQVKYRDSKLGKIQSLIKYRNGLAHGFDHEIDRARRDLETYGRILTDVLAAGRFMTRHPLYSVWVEGRGRVVGRRWVGTEPPSEPTPLPWLEARSVRHGPVFLADVDEHRVLPLFYFADVSSDGSGHHRDLLLYDGNTRSTVIYVGSDGQHVETQRRVQDIATQSESKSAGARTRSATRLGYDGLREAGARRTRRLLERLRHVGHYVPERTVVRSAIEAQLQTFEHGDYRGMVLAGENGSGKSTLAAGRAEAWLEEGHVVLFYRAATMTDVHLAPRVLRHLGVRGGFFEDFLAEAEPLFTSPAEGDRRLYVIVDALQDHPTDVGGLVRAVDDMVAQAAPHPWFRMLLTVRTPAYERLPPSQRLGLQEAARYATVEDRRGSEVMRTPLVEVGRFSDAELVEAYARHRDFRRRDPDDPEDPGYHPHRPRTSAKDLDPSGSTFALMRDPLMLRLVMTAHHQVELPAELGNDDAMRLFVDQVVEERGAGAAASPERRALLLRLAEMLDRVAADAVSRDALYEVRGLERALRNPQKDSPYVQLLDLGALVETWEGAECLVRFEPPALLHHLLAEMHAPRIDSAAALIASCERATGFSALRDALVLVVERICRRGRIELVLDGIELARGGTQPEMRTLFEDVVRDALLHLARSGEPLRPLVDALATRPGPGTAHVLSAALDQLLVSGELEHAETTARALRRLSDALDDPALKAAALFREGRVLLQRGRAAPAFEAFQRAHAAAVESEQILLAHRIQLLRARILRDRHELDEAASLFADAREGLAAEGATAEAAEALRGLASISGRAGDLERQLRLLEESRELSKRAGDVFGLAKSYNNIGRCQTQRHQFREAERALSQALELHRSLGARRSVAVAELNLGTLAYQQLHALEDAEAHWRRALDGFEKLGHSRGIAAALTNLGGSLLLRGELQAAQERLQRSLMLWETTEELGYVANAMHLLCMVDLERGDVCAARLARHAELAAELSTTTERLHAAVLAVRAALMRGADTSSVEGSLKAMEGALAALEVAPSPEDGLAFAYRDAARAHASRGERAAAVRMAERALEALGPIPVPWRDEMEAMRPSGSATATDSSEDGP